MKKIKKMLLLSIVFILVLTPFSTVNAFNVDDFLNDLLDSSAYDYMKDAEDDPLTDAFKKMFWEDIQLRDFIDENPIEDDLTDYYEWDEFHPITTQDPYISPYGTDGFYQDLKSYLNYIRDIKKYDEKIAILRLPLRDDAFFGWRWTDFLLADEITKIQYIEYNHELETWETKEIDSPEKIDIYIRYTEEDKETQQWVEKKGNSYPTDAIFEGIFYNIDGIEISPFNVTSVGYYWPAQDLYWNDVYSAREYSDFVIPLIVPMDKISYEESGEIVWYYLQHYMFGYFEDIYHPNLNREDYFATGLNPFVKK